MAVHQHPTYNHLYESVQPATHTLLFPLTDHITQPENEDMASFSTLVRAALVLAVVAQGALAQHCTCNYDAGSADLVVSQRCCEQTGGVWDASRLSCDVENRPSLFTDCCIAAGLPYQPCYE